MVRALLCEAASPIYIVIPADHQTFRLRDAGERFSCLLLDTDPRPLWPAAWASSGTQALPSPLATRHRRSGGSLPSLLHLLLGSERAPPVCSAATSFSASTDGSRFLCPRPRPLVPICCRRPACSAPSDHRIFDDSEALFLADARSERHGRRGWSELFDRAEAETAPSCPPWVRDGITRLPAGVVAVWVCTSRLADQLLHACRPFGFGKRACVPRP